MTDQNSITPPRELVEQWASEKCYDERDWLYELHIANRAAQWGADMELEACCGWLLDEALCESNTHRRLRAARRPKPPSLKEQALLTIDTAVADDRLSADVANVVRRALEQIDD
jgi:hypothetical protein